MNPLSHSRSAYSCAYSNVPPYFLNTNNMLTVDDHTRWRFPSVITFSALETSRSVRTPVLFRTPLFSTFNGCSTVGVPNVPIFRGGLPASRVCISNHSCFEKSLGYGAFGVVWLVVDPRTGRQVALKRIPCVFDCVASAKRTYRELYLLFNLKHLNVIHLLDVVKVTSFSDFRDVSILCEYMDTDLHKIIVSPQHISMDHVRLFMYQLLRGLKYLHSAGIIHRDLKPGNLLINANCLLKICDFGLARSASFSDSGEPDGSLTVEVVTQFYRSPELLLGTAHYTTAIDQWSVGCILGELLTRRILFQSMSPFRQLDMIFGLLGSPTPLDLMGLVGCPSMSIEFLLSRPVCPPNHAALVAMVTHNQGATGNQFKRVTDQIDTDLLALLTGLLAFSPIKRLSAEQALNFSFLSSGRAHFHSCLCTCCPRTVCLPVVSSCQQPLRPTWADVIPPRGGHVGLNSAGTPSSPCTPPSPFTPPPSSHFPTELMLGFGQLAVHPLVPPAPSALPSFVITSQQQTDLEPVFRGSGGQLHLNTEVELTNLVQAKRVLWNLIEDYFRRDPHRTRVVLNNFSPNFSLFVSSSLAHS
ncbi:hypothetical protein EG68_07496 [Paragonimus skrjabini miyazakii]|uniref:Mitogen-activated protein kinase n=1 Tax=Paragonimus skrjabini miyazakii TaxID=59628 RepID=A0A8S9YQA0_9TREM|nr:hypothetical protein EG68_07496 [Paragonimus skrjabini miyazakii]